MIEVLRRKPKDLSMYKYSLESCVLRGEKSNRLLDVITIKDSDDEYCGSVVIDYDNKPDGCFDFDDERATKMWCMTYDLLEKLGATYDELVDTIIKVVKDYYSTKRKED